jgi:hypothetical protein
MHENSESMNEDSESMHDNSMPEESMHENSMPDEYLSELFTWNTKRELEQMNLDVELMAAEMDTELEELWQLDEEARAACRRYRYYRYANLSPCSSLGSEYDIE